MKWPTKPVTEMHGNQVEVLRQVNAQPAGAYAPQQHYPAELPPPSAVAAITAAGYGFDEHE